MSDLQTMPVDEAIPYLMAAKALKCSRRTIERRVDAGELERIDGATPASVTRRSLVAVLERSGQSEDALTRQSAEGAQSLPPVVEHLIEQLTAAQDAAAVANARLLLLEQSQEDREQRATERDQLIADLIHGSRRERRAARKAALKRQAGEI